MLMTCYRHTDDDLELWHDLEDADCLHETTLRETEALDAISTFVRTRPCYAGVSWGKDSVVVAHLLWRVDRRIPLMHLRPTNHNPDCDMVRNAYFRQHPGQPYQEITVSYDDIDRINTPHQEMDALTDQRWYAAIHRYEQRFGQRHILGIRGEESTGRRMRMMRWGLNTPNTCAPIGRWSTADVFAYLARHHLPVHPAYAMLGGGRWPRDRLRVAEIGDTHGAGGGRREWEREYYGDVLRRLESRPSGG